MHDLLRARLLRHIEALPEAQIYQALDYLEFLSSKYAREYLREPGAFQRFSELLEDKMRGQGLAFGTIKGALGVMGTAGRVVSGITEAGRLPRRSARPAASRAGAGTRCGRWSARSRTSAGCCGAWPATRASPSSTRASSSAPSPTRSSRRTSSPIGSPSSARWRTPSC